MRKSPLLLSILAALSACSSSHEGKGCLIVAEEQGCPAQGDVKPSQLLLPDECGDDLEVDEVLSGPTRETLAIGDGNEHPACCYRVEVIDHDPQASCVSGRPYVEGGEARRAPLRTSSGSILAALADTNARAAAWARAGADEHASVAAFSRLALQLMAHGAPSELLRAVHEAALDELGHAERCWALARRFGAQVSAAGPFPFTEAVRVTTTLAELAAAAVREGCLGETLGAELAAVAAEHSIEPEVRAALTAIAAEEATHAVLSYRIVAWALGVGGQEVRAAVEAAFSAPWPRADADELALRSGVSLSLLQRAADDALQGVLEPAKSRLLAA